MTDIVLEDMTWKAKRKLLDRILKGLAEFDVNCSDEPVTDYLLDRLISMLDRLDWEEGLGTEGWQHEFGVSS